MAMTSAPSVTTVNARRRLIVKLFIIVPYAKRYTVYGKYNGSDRRKINRVLGGVYP
jgi:hypothetical protein